MRQRGEMISRPSGGRQPDAEILVGRDFARDLKCKPVVRSRGDRSLVSEGHDIVLALVFQEKDRISPMAVLLRPPPPRTGRSTC